MSLLTASKLAKSFADNDIFQDVSLEIPQRARIALVGPNGAGKTTLLNLLIGHDTPTAGRVQRANNLRIGFLPQRPELVGEHSLWDEVLHAFDTLRERERTLAELEHRMAEGDMAVVERYGKLQEAFEADGGYTYTQQAKRVLMGLGFAPDQFDLSLAVLSGGQRTRALLARLLLESPDLLALDEPTNHLDITAVEWLEGYLKDYDGAVLAISHDRYFMDAFAQHIWELNFGRMETYRANYTAYLGQREERRERLQKEFDAQRAFIAKEEDFIKRNIAGQKTRQAQGRRRRLDRLKRDGLIHAPDRDRDQMRVSLDVAHRGNEYVLQTAALTVGYPDKPLLDVADIRLARGEIAALIGPNGVGKSTLIKTVLQQVDALRGETFIGDKVEVGYFAQAHEGLNPKATVIDEIQAIKRMTPAEARAYLAPYLFRGDEVFRRVGDLSGGERGRVALAKLALGTANLLLLDEPTNHLDIPSQEVLEQMLDAYAGTVLLVSHDRYLVDALATQIWAAAPSTDGQTVGTVNVFNGSYTEYVAAREAARLAAQAAAAQARAQAQAAASPAKTSQKKHGLNPFELKKRVAELEAQIEALETQVETLHDELEAASQSGNAAAVQTLGESYTRAQSDLEAAIDAWGELVD